ncbi:MAG: hypothetical protein IKD62_02225 [Oscillospiraceae bacterium]|nr:hypothetical protein [Oscillospiraceae bacterium]
MEVRVNRSDELTHWGIKGQKWGVRRWQNEDGTLTEEGKEHYMTAARSGKLNYKKLSDDDLNKINSRFARENQFKQNVKSYQDSRFSNKLKNAVVTRISGNGGGKKGGGTGIGKLLAAPVKKAIEDALKFDAGKGGDGKNEGNGGEDEDRKFYKEYKKNGHKFVQGYKMSKKDQARLAKSGKRFIEAGSRDVESVLRSRHTSTPKPKTKTDEEKRQAKESAARRREMETEARAARRGIIIAHKDTSRYVVRRRRPKDSLIT